MIPRLSKAVLGLN